MPWQRARDPKLLNKLVPADVWIEAFGCEIAAEFLEYVTGAQLIIHNAPFDTGFLDNELALLRQKNLGSFCPDVIDTLRMAKDLHPGKRNNLDALCERYQIDNSARTLHGALLDAELLAEVYLAMTRGQESLMMELEPAPAAMDAVSGAPLERAKLMLLAASAAELAEHAEVLQSIQAETKGKCVWLKPEIEAPVAMPAALPETEASAR